MAGSPKDYNAVLIKYRNIDNIEVIAFRCKITGTEIEYC
jgi:hypothetical protein